MKNFFYLFLSLLIFGSCGGDSNSSSEERIDPVIAKLEQTFKEADSAEAAQALLDGYEAYIESNPSDALNNSIYMEKAAKIHLQGKRFETAADILQQSLKVYPNSRNSTKMIALLGTLYEKDLSNPFLATTVWQALQANGTAQVEVNVNEKLKDAKPIDERMSALLYEMTDSLTGRYRFPVAANYINSAELFAAIAPKATQSPEFLYKAGEIARIIRMFDRSDEIYSWIVDKYPTYEKAPKALFMRAFTMEEDLGKTEEARALYLEFLEKYPEDDFADDAQMLLDNLGKTEEEILQQFEQEVN